MSQKRERTNGSASRGNGGLSRSADIFASYVERLTAGEPIDVEAIRRDHPDRADELIEELRVFEAAFDDSPTKGPLGTLGDYTLRRRIGRGGMGVVYEAWENSMDRAVALKVLPSAIAADEKTVARFIREAQIAGRLKHPNIVPVYGMGVKEQTPYYVMEHVEGETLAEILGRLKEVGPDADTPFGKKDSVVYFGKLAEVFADVADGLQCAHSGGVIHRDIKPSNLILDAERRLRILDFGLARLEGQASLTLTGDYVGTPLYMSPEQARRKKIRVDHRTDIYSLGATMYETLTGRPPFRGKDHSDTLSQIVEREPPAPRSIQRRIPLDLGTVVLKCLRKDPDARYRTAEALAQDLRRFARGDPIEARPPTRWERVASRLRQHRRGVLAGGVIGGLLLVCAFLVVRSTELVKENAELIDLAYEKTVRGALASVFREERLLDESGSIDATGLVEFADLDLLVPAGSDDPLLVAVDRLRDAIRDRPDRFEAYYAIARALDGLNRRDEAREAAEETLRRSAGFVPARFLLARIESTRDPVLDLEAIGRDVPRDSIEALWIEATTASLERHWEAAERAWAAILRREKQERKQLYLGSSVEHHLARGLALLELERWDAADDEFLVAATLGPDLLEPVLLRGKALHLGGRPDRAAALFADLHQNAGDDATRSEVAVWVAVTYQSIGDGESMVDWAKKVPEAPLRYRLESRALGLQYREDEAIVAARKAVLAAPEDPYARLALIAAFLRRDWDSYGTRLRPTLPEIYTHARIANRLAPRSALVAQVFGVVQALVVRYGVEVSPPLRDFEGAIAASERAVALDPRRVEGRVQLGVVNLLADRPDAALENIERAIELDRRNPDPWAWKGILHGASGEFEAAREAYRRARQLDTGFRWVLAWSNAALLALRAGDADESIELLRESTRINPRRGWTHECLAGFFVRRGDWQQALDVFRGDYAVPAISRSANSRLLRLLLECPDPQALEGLAEVAAYLANARRQGQEMAVEALAALAVLEVLAPGRGERETAEALAREALEMSPTKQSVVEAAALVRHAIGDRRGAVVLLEESLASPSPRKSAKKRLAAYRRELSFPVSFASVDALIDSAASTAKLREVLAHAPAGEVEGHQERVRVYLEACVLQAEGRPSESVEVLEALERHSGADSVRPFLRRIACLRELGRLGDRSGRFAAFADSALGEGSAIGPGDERLFWETWIVPELASVEDAGDLDRCVRDALERRSRRTDHFHVHDLLWLLSELAGGRPLRINSNGERYEDSTGELWYRDAFFAGGAGENRVQSKNHRDVIGSEDGTLYRLRRRFSLYHVGRGYRIPLPRGEYSVTVHLVEGLRFGPGQRIFDVVGEGQVLVERYETLSAGFCVAHSLTRRVRVEDGRLDLEFVSHREQPEVSAIEVRRAE